MAQRPEREPPSTPQLLDDLETGIEALRIEYEKYFLGIERQAPAQQHKKVEMALRHLETLRLRSTALRFRLAGLRARLVTYGHYWTRTLHQIETGVHRRGLRGQRRPLPEPAPLAAPIEPPAPSAAVPPRRASPPPLPPPPPVARTSTSLDTAAMRKLYDELVAAKRAAGEDTSGLVYKALVRKLEREASKLAESGTAVRFEVANVGGKITLRARTLPKPA